MKMIQCIFIAYFLKEKKLRSLPFNSLNGIFLLREVLDFNDKLFINLFMISDFSVQFKKYLPSPDHKDVLSCYLLVALLFYLSLQSM